MNICPVKDQRILILLGLKMKCLIPITFKFSPSWPVFVFTFVQPIICSSSLFEWVWKLLDIFFSLNEVVVVTVSASLCLFDKKMTKLEIIP